MYKFCLNFAFYYLLFTRLYYFIFNVLLFNFYIYIKITLEFNCSCTIFILSTYVAYILVFFSVIIYLLLESLELNTKKC